MGIDRANWAPLERSRSGRAAPPGFAKPQPFLLLLAALTLSCGVYAADFQIPLMPAASNAVQQGFARIVNRSDEAGTVQIRAIDDAGSRHGPVTLSLDARATAHFNSEDLELGNSTKGLSGGVGDGDGDWRLELETSLDIEALAYIRTVDGFLTAMHDVAPRTGEQHRVLTFNPASNRNQQSRLRLLNTGGRAARATIRGRDDRGRSPPEGDVRLTLPAGASRTITAQQLEAGGDGIEGRFGDGSGKWQLFVTADSAIKVMSLLESPTGNLTNLSSRSASAQPNLIIPLMPAASNAVQQGFARIVNRSDEAGTVQIRAIDDAGSRHGPVTLSLDARATAHFNSEDLELGNSTKGLSGGVGDGDGDWRLELETSLDIEALAYIRTVDGFLTAMHDVAPRTGEQHRVLTFNPASNRNQQSRLRLLNTGGRAARATIRGRDDRGRSPPEGDVRLTLPAGASRTITAQQLEAGGDGIEGRFGDGSGKWQLFVTADSAIKVMSLLESPTGNLTNLSSTSPRPTANTAPVAYDISLQTDGSALVEAQLIGTDADNDVVSFYLNAPPEGDGYSDAFVDRDSGRLVVTLRDDGVKEISLSYKVTDGLLFSNAATITIAIEGIRDSDSTGLLGTGTSTYSRLPISELDTSGLPSSIDLRGQFPVVQSQGSQSSCVGWAVGYALKSYQERMEERWEFVQQTTFSAAWVYNQINNGIDSGSRIDDAMELIIRRGAATNRTMPYREYDFLHQPTSQAIAEASNYRARSQATVRTVLQIKAHLANRIPAILGIDIPATGFNGVEIYSSRPMGETYGHAVAVVGYDDRQYGGAFLIMNSWGYTSHRGDGHFWITYDLLPDILIGAHVMFDSRNGRRPSDDIPVRPPEDLPNLQVASWRATYNPHSGGSGWWEWRILNTGTAGAPEGIDVNLILSLDQRADVEDRWLEWEEIPFAIPAGEGAQRSVEGGNVLPFTIPSDVDPGLYYMGVWVDDVQEVVESDENDNVSFDDDRVQILEDLPDLEIDRWRASWEEDGDGEFTYTILNGGSGPTTTTLWDVNLILSTQEDPTRGEVYFLFYEDAGHLLDPGDTVFRDSRNPAYFNFFETQSGRNVPSGVYYFSVWVDDQNDERESDEDNNVSVDSSTWKITRGRPDSELNRVRSTESLAGARTRPLTAFGGRVDVGLMRKVWIDEDTDGGRRVTFFSMDDGLVSTRSPAPVRHATVADQTTLGRRKVAESADAVLYPTSRSRAMPKL